LRFQPFDETGIPHLLKWLDSPEMLAQWSGARFRYPLTEEQLKHYVSEIERKAETVRAYQVVDDQGNPVGHVELNHIDKEHGCARISRVLVAPGVRGKGLGQRVMREALRIGFEELKLHRLELFVFDFNHAAIRLYEKLGFVKEGLIRHRLRVGDQYWNAYLMSLLEDEFRDKYAKGSPK